MGYNEKVKHQIVITGKTPIRIPYRRIPNASLKEVLDHFQGLLEKYIIRSSASP